MYELEQFVYFNSSKSPRALSLSCLKSLDVFLLLETLKKKSHGSIRASSPFAIVTDVLQIG